MHQGLDIAAPIGTPIMASRAGTVIFAGWQGGYGNFVLIDHGGGYVTGYGHQSRLGTTVGADVARGQVIGFVGSTGHSTGPHCHFEVRVNGHQQNPRQFLPAR
jgi:murein DD-endopeptidase MepM/ murein hydrolase activator NlpD